MTDNRNDLHIEARKTGGPCAVCGWKDGDGVKTCFVSSDLGAVTHENSEAGAEATMTAAQRSLYRLRMTTCFVSETHRERCIADEDARHRAQHRAHDIAGYAFPFYMKDGKEVSDDAWIAEFAAAQAKVPLATDEPYNTWVWRPGDGCHAVACEPHECGGIQRILGPHHFGCTGCDIEVKLWEHGIDCDVE